MIGVCRERSRWRISAAVSNPSMPGIWTSSRMTAKSWSSSRLSASAPDWPGPGSGRGRRGWPPARGGSPGRSSTMRMSTLVIMRMGQPRRRRAESGQQRRDPRQRQDVVGGAGRQGGVGHGPALGRRGLLDDDQAAAPLDPRRPRGPVPAGPGQDHADGPLAVRIGRRLEEHVDRRPRVADPPLGREGEPAPLDQEMIIGRGQVDPPGRDDLLVLRLADRERRRTAAGRR